MPVLSPPSTASSLYKTLHATAIEYIHSHNFDTTQPTRMNIPRLRAIRAPNYSHAWGHRLFTLTSPNPQLRTSCDLNGLLAHLNMMLPALESWEAAVEDVIVDEVRKACVLRTRYAMQVKGEEEVVENDMVWWLEMASDGGKVERAVEFLDGVAVGRVGEMIKGARGK